ncbi:hypothetical protein [Pendulispora albinea]|uniref:Tryptophan synthase alpha chain n=1 Tax=Pendulispora albinea TaxID=2741071 RepID=A0ABZ2M6M2_9BACT
MTSWRKGVAAVAFGLAGMVLVAAGGCEAIVDGNVPSFRCDATLEAGVCPAGQYCLGSTCVPEGTGPGPALIDCGDRKCAAGQRCAPKNNECVDAATACTSDNCPAGTACDFGTLKCLEPAKKGLGESCKGDLECSGGAFCGYTPVLTADVVTVDGLCTKPCCRSDDCPADFVCYGAGTGGNYCVSKGILQRPALGARKGGEACTVQADCRSGICDPATNKCADTCCNSTQCTNGTVCRAMDVRGKADAKKFVLGCGVSDGTADPGALCGGIFGPRCKEGLCDTTTTRCEMPCCGSAACTSYCDNTRARDHSEIVTACTDVASPRGPKANGAPCEKATECAGNRCIQDSPAGAKYCSDACCIDPDCGGDLVCRPRDIGGGQFHLRCVHR